MHNLYKQLNQTVYWLCHRLHNINLQSMYGNEASFLYFPDQNYCLNVVEEDRSMFHVK
jgi:hypothetical protein